MPMKEILHLMFRKINHFFYRKYIYFLLIVIATQACKSPKEIVYFRDSDSNNTEINSNYYDLKIAPDDLLSITVSAMDLEAVRPFNLPIISLNNTDGRATGQPVLQTYLVSRDGKINFPVLGQLEVAGLSRSALEKDLSEKLKKFVTDPIITVRITNFKVTVLGEVARPGSFVIPNERISLPEALGLAGDMTIQGRRQNVSVIREENGNPKQYFVDMTNKQTFNSPVYFLKQNDIVYVEPNSTKIKSSSVGPNTTIWLSIVSTLITLIAVITR